MLLEELVTGRNLTLAGGIVVAVMVLRQVFQAFWVTPAGKRLLPILPVVLGVLGAFAGMAEATTWQDKLVLGMLAGYVAGHSFQVGKTSVLGRGVRSKKQEAVEDAPAEAAAGPAESKE